MKFVIFSIDQQDNTAVVSKMLRDFRAADTRGSIVVCLGSYKGVEENSFLCRYDDFRAHIDPELVKGQESFLRVSECNKAYARLEYRDGSYESIGCLQSVDGFEAFKHDAWTYRPDLDLYWIAVQGNPDGKSVD